jgi:23S rRNA pseudouridine955/2504/2580 synthase
MSIWTACLEGLMEDSDARPKLVHRLDKGHVRSPPHRPQPPCGGLLLEELLRAAPPQGLLGSGRRRSGGEGRLHRFPIGKHFGTGGEKMCVDEEQGFALQDPLPVVERAGNRAAWVELQPLYRPHPPAPGPHGAIGHPIVGDGKYGGADAFLTGAISRKLHLHARRLGSIIPTAAESMSWPTLRPISPKASPIWASTPRRATCPLDEVKFSETPEGKRKLATAAAKARRKDRKGRAAEQRQGVTLALSRGRERVG